MKAIIKNPITGKVSKVPSFDKLVKEKNNNENNEKKVTEARKVGGKTV